MTTETTHALRVRIEAALDYSANFATAKPDIGVTERQHILGLCKLLRDASDALAASQEAPKAGEPWAPEKCPITGRPFFMWIERDGREVPTYGGPFDSYTIPVRGSDDYLSVQHFDHDRGYWVDDECLGLMVVPECRVPDVDEVIVPREPTKAQTDAARDWSVAKYGQGIGNEAARGCYAAMLAAAPTPPASQSAKGDAAPAGDAEHLLDMIADMGEWHRNDGCTHLAIRVADGADLTCKAFRRDALRAALNLAAAPAPAGREAGDVRIAEGDIREALAYVGESAEGTLTEASGRLKVWAANAHVRLARATPPAEAREPVGDAGQLRAFADRIDLMLNSTGGQVSATAWRLMAHEMRRRAEGAPKLQTAYAARDVATALALAAAPAPAVGEAEITVPADMLVSVDVSQGEHDAEHRIFARTTGEVIQFTPEGRMDDPVILCIEESRNFTTPAANGNGGAADA